MKNGAETIDILGINVSSNQISQVLTLLENKMNKELYDRPFFVVTVNPEFIMLAQEDQEFKWILNSADLAIPDGVGLRLAGIKKIIPGRVLVEKLLKMNLRTFYLGGRNGVSEAMAKKYGGEYDSGAIDIKSQISNPKIQTNSNDQILKKINEYRPDLLLVAYGAPWQEKWLFANRSSLRAKVVMGVGGTFDYLTGRTKLPPEWISKVGLEWLWRLIHEPWRWKRQVNLVRFGWKILMS